MHHQIHRRPFRLLRDTFHLFFQDRDHGHSTGINGQGIAAEVLEKVFDKGESGGEDGTGSGLGLGLAIVKTFIEAHDGHVAVDSVMGQGSRFHFTIPA